MKKFKSYCIVSVVLLILSIGVFIYGNKGDTFGIWNRKGSISFYANDAFASIGYKLNKKLVSEQNLALKTVNDKEAEAKLLYEWQITDADRESYTQNLVGKDLIIFTTVDKSKIDNLEMKDLSEYLKSQQNNLRGSYFVAEENAYNYLKGKMPIEGKIFKINGKDKNTDGYVEDNVNMIGIMASSVKYKNLSSIKINGIEPNFKDYPFTENIFLLIKKDSSKKDILLNTIKKIKYDDKTINILK